MRRSAMFTGIIHIALAILLTYFAVNNVNMNGWDIFSIILVLLATFDFGTGLRLMALHFKLRKIERKK